MSGAGAPVRRSAAALHALLAALALAAPLPGCGGSPPVTPVTAGSLDSLRRGSAARVVLVNVWATWCRPCLDEMPGIVRLRDAYSRSDLDVILLSADDLSDLDTGVVPFLRNTGVDFPTYIIGERDQDAVIRALDPEWSGALPATFITPSGGGGGKLLVGERSYEQLKHEVDAFLGR